MILAYILISVIIVSLVAFVGVLTLFLKQKLLEKILFWLVSFAAGALLGAAFLDLLPEALEHSGGVVLIYALIGVVTFYIIETFMFWYHCHYGHHHHHKHPRVKSFAYLNLVGDGVHNFVDGMIIAAAYLTSTTLGLTTTLAVILHEIPQELGDFGILIYGGFKRGKALFFNFLCAVSAIFGALAVYAFSARIEHLTEFLVPFAAGGFIYIASADLIPELHKETNFKKALMQLLCFILGMAIIYAITFLHPH